MNGGRVFTGQLGLHTALSCAIPTWVRLKGGCGSHPNLIIPTNVLTRAVSKIKRRVSPYLNLQFLRYRQQGKMNIIVIKDLIHSFVVLAFHNWSCAWAFSENMPHRLNPFTTTAQTILTGYVRVSPGFNCKRVGASSEPCD